MSSVRWRDLPDDSDEEADSFPYRQYEQTLMYGCYRKDLSDYIREEAKKLKKEEIKPENDLDRYRGKIHSKCSWAFKTMWKHSFAKVGEDWVFLAVLGIMMACLSFIMDFGIAICNNARVWLYRDLTESNVFLQYISWVFLPVCLIIFASGFVQLTAPQAVGSGIPEMKTILRGVVLKEYLTFKTLVAKIIGLTATLGAGLPLGKEGPFVHIASIVATLLSKAVTSFKGIYENQSRSSDMLSAACAVGVACSFGAPIGGVLFSIEVTSVYFAVRNYWRGFFAATFGAMMFRLLAVWCNYEETLTALFQTHFESYPFDPMELFAFALTGVACGFLGALFVWVHRQYVMFMRRNKKMKFFLQKSRLLYPILVIFVYCSLTFPLGFGMLVAGKLTTHHQVSELLSNVTWTKKNPTVHEFGVIEHWRTPWTNVFVNLIIYILFTFCSSVVASTLPVPSGIFIPVLKMGAALGRFVGEGMAVAFPYGLNYGLVQHSIIPGGYALVGAAAFAGAVTHTISTSVIVFELTGQITHILPVMVAVLIANGIAQVLQPSIYDSIIKIKKLPYLPDILTSTSSAYDVYVEDFMIRDVKYIWYGITYRMLKQILIDNKKIRALPIVDSPESMVLLGSVQRTDLITLLEEQFEQCKRSETITRWKDAARKSLWKEIGERCKWESDIQTRFFPTDGRSPKNSESALSQANDVPALSITPCDSYENITLPKFPKANKALEVRKSPPKRRSSRSSNEEFHKTKKPAAETVNVGSLTKENRPDLSLALGLAQNVRSSSPSLTLMINGGGKNNGSSEKLKPSRFEVTKVETPSKNESSVTLQVEPYEIPLENKLRVRQSNSLPKKSILKKTRSFTLQTFHDGSPVQLTHSPTFYATVHAGDASFKFRQAVESVMMRKRSLLKTESKNSLKLKPFSPTGSNGQKFKGKLAPESLLARAFEMQEEWEDRKLEKKVDFSHVHIDPSPFQLVERTSLLKVHSLFSLLNLNHAYVTAIGRLIGVVALKELRRSIEDTNFGDLSKYDSTYLSSKGEEGGLRGRVSPSNILQTNPTRVDSKSC